MRLRQRRIARERRFVGVDGAFDITGFRQAHPSRQGGARIFAQRRDGAQHRIVEPRPARAVTGVRRRRAAGVVGAAERAVGPCQGVVRGAELRKQRDRALEVADGVVLPAACGADATESDFRGRLRRGDRRERNEQLFALREVAGLEQHFGEPEPAPAGSPVARQARGGERSAARIVTSQPLQHDRVEIAATRSRRREDRGAFIRLVRRVPLLPCLQQPAERTARGGIARVRGGYLVLSAKASRAAGGNVSKAIRGIGGALGDCVEDPTSAMCQEKDGTSRKRHGRPRRRRNYPPPRPQARRGIGRA